MNFKSTLPSVIFLLLLTACSSSQLISQPKIYNEQLKKALAFSKSCDESNDSNPDVALTYSQIIVKGLNPANRSELLATNKTLSDLQKTAYQNYLQLDNACVQGAIALVKDSPFENLMLSADAMSAVNDSNLLSGKITISEANAKKLEIAQKFLADVTLLKQQFDNQIVLRQTSGQTSGYSASQDAINRMNTATQIRQNQMTQQLLQQNQYKAPTPCIGFNCR